MNNMHRCLFVSALCAVFLLAHPVPGDRPVISGAAEYARPETPALDADSKAPKQAKPAPSTQTSVVRRERTVDFVWYSGDQESARGGVSPMTIRVEDNPSGVASVGVVEEYVSGLGDMWRTATWIAAINAAQANRQYVNDYEFLVRVGGHVDGPSAGMLITVAMLAAIRGDELLPHTTMTGTINPDGTCGPVGGIPQKMHGAVEKGHMRFGYPIGARMSEDAGTGERVDLHAHGRRLGMAEVRPISTLEEAYHFFTGVHLEPVSPATEADMELSFEMQQQLRARSQAVLARMQTRAPRIMLKLERAPPQLAMTLIPLFEMLGNLSQAVVEYDTAGWFTAAYSETMRIELLLRYIEMELDFAQPLIQGDMAAAETHVASLSHVRQSVEAFAREVSALSRRRTIGGRLNAMNAMGHYAHALAHIEIADSHVEQYLVLAEAINQPRLRRHERDQILGSMIEALNMALLNYAIAEMRVDYSRELMNLAVEEGPVSMQDLSALANCGKAFASAAAACLAYFDSLVLKPVAEATQMSMDQIRTIMGQQEVNYPFVWVATRGSILAGRWFEDPHEQALYQIGLGTKSYIHSAALVNKYYSLGAYTDESGTVHVGNRRLLTVQLDVAKQRALEAAGRCLNELGFIPSACQMAYQLGTAYREGDDGQKLQALDSFWNATQIAELAILLGR